MPEKKEPKKNGIFGVDFNVFMLGIVSFLTDVSSEMIFSVFSIFFTVVLGASAALLGLIEGLADFASSSLDYISGALSDKTGKRKKYAAIGYGFSAAAKSLLVFASTVLFASAFRVLERLGKSFRGPPRDAWISSLSTDKNRGLSFGLHKALDKSGAIVGPLIAYFVLDFYGSTMGTFQMLFVIALVPAILSVALLLLIKENPASPRKRESIFTAHKTMKKEFHHYLKSAGIFSLVYFSFGFLLLKAYSIGFAIKDVVLLYALFNVAFVIVAVPIGKLGDIIGRKKIIMLGYLTYAIMSLGFVFAATKLDVILLFLLFGVFYAIDEAQSKAYISDIEKDQRGTAIGLYNFVTGLIYLPASIIAGFLWTISPSYAFLFATVMSLAALAYFSLKS
ncbi:MAG: MFS transporter [Candidatus Aenigmarchaeota archaeon]|nr:MFS transporter [Candidatus Aenigmarchaeota archaeon]